MSKVRVPENERKTSVNISLPFWMIEKLNDYVAQMKQDNIGLPASFSRSDLIRICVDRMVIRPFKVKDLKTGKDFQGVYENYDILKFEVMKEYDLINVDQCEFDFECSDKTHFEAVAGEMI